MFDIKLLDIIQIITIGVFAIMLLVFMYFVYHKFFVKDEFNETEFFKWLSDKVLNGNFKESGMLITTMVLVYFFGIVAGDLTDRMSDSSSNRDKSFVMKELNVVSGMPDVGQIRLGSLITPAGELTTLGSSVFTSPKLLLEANKINKTRFFLDNVKDSVTTQPIGTLAKSYLSKNRDAFNKFISLAFYASKNWCYSKDNEPLAELKAIQVRMDLSRSTVLLATVGIQFTVLSYLIFLVINAGAIRGRTIREDHLKSVNRTTKRAVFILVPLIFFCGEAFKNCQYSYNRRAFGYYVSHLAQPEPPKQIELDYENVTASKAMANN